MKYFVLHNVLDKVLFGAILFLTKTKIVIKTKTAA